MMKKERVAIIGAGNLGQAMAGHLALEGYDVSIQNRTHSKIDEINSRGGIKLTGVFDDLARLEVASYDFSDVVPGRKVIVVTVPASSHAEIARKVGPYLEPGQFIALHPGHTFGAFEFHHTLLQMGIDTPVTLGEIQTSLLTCRLTGPAEVNVSAIKNALPISVFPANHGFDRARLLFEVYPTSLRAESVLKTSMDNLNAVVHPTVTLLNTGRIESPLDFLYYWEGFTPAINDVVLVADAERCALARALGVEPITLHGFFDTAYPTEGPELWKKIRSNEAYRHITAPTSMRTRLIMEDLPTGLVPYSSLGKALGIPTPLCDSLIEICSAMMQTDFRVDGRTLENLGLAGLGAEGIRRFAETGER